MEMESGVIIDSHRIGCDCKLLLIVSTQSYIPLLTLPLFSGRFANHACRPNCEIQKWWVNKISRMALFALRDISVGEEITYDYKFETFDSVTKKV